MSSVPRAVLEAEEKANQLLEELAKQQQPSEELVTPPTEVTPPAHEENPPPANDSQTPPVGQQEDSWEHRFKVLQGKYNSEVPRFAQENKELKQRMEAMESELLNLKNAKPVEPLVTQDEVEQYGEGLIDVARRIAQEELAKKQSEIDTLKTELSQIKTTTTNTVQRDFFKSLSELVPEWQKVNEDPAFLKWLDEVDDLAGASRQELLARAEQARDAVRVAKFFTSFQKTSSTWAANSNAALEQQIVPPTNKAPNTPPAKKIWTRGEITDFYNRMRRGEVSDSDAIAIEADITAAQVEGRIR